MIDNNIYCKASGMVMQCIADTLHLPIVCEIGTADGQGVARYGGFCKKVIGIDPMVGGRPDLNPKKEITMRENPKKVKTFWENVNHIKDNVQLIKGCSGLTKTFAEFQAKLNTDMLDILLIDGCHHPFEAVWKDFEMYHPFVREGGFVIFDDLYEKCIMKAYKKAQDYGYIVHDEYEVRNPKMLQYVGALKKTSSASSVVI